MYISSFKGKVGEILMPDFVTLGGRLLEYCDFFMHIIITYIVKYMALCICSSNISHTLILYIIKFCCLIA